MTDKQNQQLFHEVVSPFCGLACDDLTIKVEKQHITVVENGDKYSQRGFETPLIDMAPRVNGQQVSLDTAIEHCQQMIEDSQQTVISGLATDVNGSRSALSLADKCGASIDHMNAKGLLSNTLVLQDTGWMVTTLSEVKNRVDLLVVVGSDISHSYPRFFDRVIWPDHTLFSSSVSNRKIVYLGAEPAVSSSSDAISVIPCQPNDLPEVMAILRALINHKPIQAEKVGGVAIAALEQLAEALLSSQYSVITWAAGEWQGQHNELTIQTLCEMIKDVNRTTRCSGLPLAGKEGDITVNQVAAWQTGYPIRTSFQRGFPDYDPYLYDSQRMLDNNEVDTLIWVSSFDTDRKPPQSQANTIVLGRAGMTFEREPEVFIPVGTPGIDHSGHIFRSDSVVALPLKQLRKSCLPSVSDVLSAIEATL